jgi:excisionase family DNA binding protein
MSVLADALLRELDEDALAELAARLQPYLTPTQTVDEGWLRGADAIAAHIGCPRSRVYALASAGRIPVHRDGTALLARKPELDAWLLNGGGRRP